MFLKKLSGLLAVICLFFTLSNSVTAAETAKTAEHTVEIKGMEFSPKTLTIKAGDKVKFINKDSAPHTASATDGRFESGELAEGQSEIVTFEKADTYAYYCMFHPSMSGKIIVE
jgi:plastocyanin